MHTSHCSPVQCILAFRKQLQKSFSSNLMLYYTYKYTNTHTPIIFYLHIIHFPSCHTFVHTDVYTVQLFIQLRGKE